MNTDRQTEQRRVTLAASRPRKPFRVDAFITRRLPLIAIAGGLLFAALALLLLPWARPIYETEGVLLVDPAKEPTLTGREREVIPGDLGDYTRTLVSRFTRFDILADALRALEPTNYPSFLQPGDPEARNVYRLMKRVRMQEVPRTHLMKATLADGSPQGLGPALEAVMQSFVQHLQAEQEQKNVRRLAYLRAERDLIVRRIEEERKRLLAMAEQVENKSFLHEAYTVHLSKMEQIQRLYWEAAGHAAELQGQLQEARHNREQLAKMDLQPFADERVADNFGINRIEQWTYEQLQSMRAGIDGLTPDNQDRLYVEARMAAMNDYLVTYKSNVNVQTIHNLTDKRTFELDAAVLKAQNAYDGAQAAADLLARRLAEAQQEAARVSEAIFQAGDLTYAITSLRERLTALNNRIDDCELEAKAPLRISIDRPASTPGRPARTNRSTLLALALVLGFGSVAGLCLAFDFMDDRVRGARDVAAALGGPGPDPLASHVAEVAETPGFTGVLLERPDHPAARALRDLVVRLDSERERNGARLFLVAGAEPAAGATTLALHVDHLFTATCTRVLLVELNRERTGLAAAVGLPAGGPALEDAVANRDLRPVTDQRRHLDVLPARGGEPLLDQAALLNLLTKARREYEAVVLDTAPLHRDALAHFCALHADTALLVARRDQTLYADLRASVVLLVQAGIPALAAVFNGAHGGPDTARLRQDALASFSRLHVLAAARGRDLLQRALARRKRSRA